MARKTPFYWGLQLGSVVLIIIALAYYAVGGWMIYNAVERLWQATNSTPANEPVEQMQIAWGVGCVSVGALLHAAAAGCNALRDIARNSFATQSG